METPVETAAGGESMLQDFSATSAATKLKSGAAKRSGLKERLQIVQPARSDLSLC
jgi:hypothetical protein